MSDQKIPVQAGYAITYLKGTEDIFNRSEIENELHAKLLLITEELRKRFPSDIIKAEFAGMIIGNEPEEL
jgi:hypothetical protein